jgi:hypothetical protein
VCGNAYSYRFLQTIESVSIHTCSL